MCNCNSNGCGCGCKPQGSCGCSSSCCEQKSCGCGCGSSKDHKGCDYAAKFLELADHAWMEVLKEKIKEQIRNNSKHLDELAHIISEANHEKWEKKMEEKKGCCGYETKLKEFFHQCCGDECSTNKPQVNKK